MIDESTLLKLRTRMVKHAQANFHRDPEDIASHYVTRLLEGYHQSATVGQAYIDICRLSHGRKGQPGYEAKRTLDMLAISDAQNSAADFTPVEMNVDDRLDLEKVLGKIKCQRTTFIFKQLLMGYTQDEIALQLGLSLGRINQIVNRTLTSLARDQRP